MENQILIGVWVTSMEGGRALSLWGTLGEVEAESSTHGV